MSYKAKHEGVADIMVLQAAGIRLTNVTEITDAKGDTTQAKVHRQKLTKVECIARMSTDDVMPNSTL